jgi:hypothetical protein
MSRYECADASGAVSQFGGTLAGMLLRDPVGRVVLP